MLAIRPTRGIAIPHPIELCYGSPLHCHWHNVDEPADNPYRVCFECSHVYATPGELLAAWIEQWDSSGEPWPIIEPEKIPGCAYCAHDW